MTLGYRLKPFPSPPHLRLDALGRCPLFGNLRPEVLWELVPGTTLYQVRRRQIIFREDDGETGCWLLVSGLAKVSQSTACGREIIHRLVSPGELLGGLSAGPDLRAPSTSAVALEASLVVAVLQPFLEQALLRYPGLGRNAVRVLLQRLRQMEDDHVRLATGKIEDRLAEMLVRLAERVGRPCPEGIQLGLTREDLAQMVGTNHFSVSRQLAQWESQGFLLSRREVVVIVDGPGLLEAARPQVVVDATRRAG